MRCFCIYEFVVVLFVVVYKSLVFALKVRHIRSKGMCEEIKKNSGKRSRKWVS